MHCGRHQPVAGRRDPRVVGLLIAVLELVEHIPGEWKMLSSSLTYEKENANTLKYEIVLPARSADGPAVVNLEMHYHRLNIR